MASIPTNTTVVLQRHSDSVVDDYGVNRGPYEDVATYQAWVERTRYNEPQLDGETDASDFLVLLPGAVDLVDGDRIIYRDEPYEIAADPYQQTVPGGAIHHTEGRMRPAVVDSLRDKAILSMRDICRITRQSSDVFDPSSGQVTPGAATEIYDGPCTVRARDAYNRETNVVSDATTLQSYTCAVPWDVDDVEDDDVLTVTQTDDPRLLNRSLRVTGVNVTSNNAARIVFLEDNLG